MRILSVKRKNIKLSIVSLRDKVEYLPYPDWCYAII